MTPSKAQDFKARQFEQWSRKVMVDKSVSSTDCAVIVSYFLPVKVQRLSKDRWVATWEDEALLAMQIDLKVARIGSLRYPGGIPIEEEDAVSQALLDLNCFPVFLSQKLHHHFYDIFCKTQLWPILHHVADVYGTHIRSEDSAQAQQDIWFTYTTVNRLFRDKVVEIYQRGDLIWIHGFHLLLLPSFVRRVLPLSKIGFFFHTPFPSSEIWKTMNRRKDLLRGVLGADHIGFHLYEYARHFLTTCHRLLGHSHGFSATGSLAVNVDGRNVAITCMHVGIDLPKVQMAMTSPEFTVEYEQWKNRFPGKVVFAGIDRIERLKGIPLKLVAIEQFIEENPKWREKICFVIIGIPARERGDDYRQTQNEVKLLVERINTKFRSQSGDLIIFEEREDTDIDLKKRLAFFAASDVLLISSTRDGLNRMPMEFTLARSKNAPSDSVTEGGGLLTEGLLIISEFVSSARVMRGGLVINPWRIEELKGALSRVLEMSRTERADRMRRNLEFSTRLTTENWTLQVLQDLKSVEKSEDVSSYSAVGFGMGFRVMGVKSGFEPVDTSVLSKAYRNANCRLILLDWGGTLVADIGKHDKLQAFAIAQGTGKRAGPSVELKEVLENLCEDPRNNVFVVSGKEITAVGEFFGDIVGLGLGAEHGFYHRWPRVEGKMCPGGARPFTPSVAGDRPSSSTPSMMGGKWQSIGPLGDQSWKESAEMVMEIYTQRTHGTYIERKGNALIWQFRDADPEFGFMQSKELEDHLIDIMNAYQVEVIRGGGVSDGYIEVRPSGVSKGLFLEHAMKMLKTEYQVDFLLAIGDDTTDEPMFEQIRRLEGNNYLSSFGITVGRKPSLATAYVDDPSAVLDLLLSLSKAAQRDKRYFSAVDLSGQSSPNAGNLARSASENLIARSAAGDRVNIGGSSVGSKSEKDGSGAESSAIPRTNSLVDISMKEYLDSINRQDDGGDDDDDGLFF